jgi:hypothetical protein
MLFGVPPELWTPAGLLAVVFIMVMRGVLVPKRFYNEKVAEASRWQLAFETQRERADKSDAQAEQMLEQGKATHALITAIFNNSTAIRQSGEQNVV